MKIKLIYTIQILLLFSMLAACSTTYQVTKPNKNGLFPTSLPIKRDEILIDKQIDLSAYKNLLVVGITATDPEIYNFWIKSLASMKYFKHVVPTNKLGSFFKNQGYTDLASYSFSDIFVLRKLREYYGPFLLVTITTAYEGGADDQTTLSVMDPGTKKIYFKVKRQVTNWDGLDSILFYPILNAFHQWVEKNSH